MHGVMLRVTVSSVYKCLRFQCLNVHQLAVAYMLNHVLILCYAVFSHGVSINRYSLQQWIV